MTIASFCRDQLLAHGPLPLRTLAELAADAGKTTSRDPASAVRSALVYKEVLLADGRWATPLWLLEGRILTARRLPLTDGWPPLDVGDADDAALRDGLLMQSSGQEDDGTHHDLALLDQAARSGPLPLAAGGLLSRSRYGSGWQAPKGWPGVVPGCDELLGMQVRDGEIHIELVPMTDELHRAGELLAEDLGPLDAPGRYWSRGDALVSENLVAALWERLAADPRFLRSPVPPFSQCIPALALALRRERDRRAAEASRWRPQLDLPADLQALAVREARRSGHLLDEWLDGFVSRTLHELCEEGDRAIDEGDYDVIPLQRRLRRL